MIKYNVYFVIMMSDTLVMTLFKVRSGSIVNLNIKQPAFNSLVPRR